MIPTRRVRLRGSSPRLDVALIRTISQSVYVHVFIYICYPHFVWFTTKNTVFCRCETCPHRPTFCMTPPAGKILVQVLFLLRPLLSVFVSVFIIRIVISIIIIIIHKHDYYHCHCPCHVQYQYHHTYCKMNFVAITMILVLLLACCYYYQV